MSRAERTCRRVSGKRLRATVFAVVFVLVFAVSLAGATGVASAATNEEIQRSRQLYKKGENAFATGDYEQAATLFQQAYEISQLPQLLWNLAAAHRRWFEIDPSAAHLRKARAIYENYASLIGKPKEAAEAKQQVAQIDAKLAEVEKMKAVQAAPAPIAPIAPIAREAQKLEVATASVVTSSEKAAERVAKSEASVGSPLAAPKPNSIPATISSQSMVPVEKPAEEKSTPVYRKWWLWTAVGVAVVGAGVGVGLALGLPHDASEPSGLTAGSFKPMWP